MAAAGMGNIKRDEEAPVERLHQAAGLLGIFTCSVAITLAMREPPLGFNKVAYFLAIAATFFAGIAAIVTAVCVTDNPRGRRAAGRNLIIMYASVVGLSAASLLW